MMASPGRLRVVAPTDANQDAAQQSLVTALQSSFNVLRILMYVLVLLYLGTGVFYVETGQKGVVARFGVLRESGGQDGLIFGPGVHLGFPEPFEEKMRISSTLRTMQIDTFLFSRTPENMSKPLREVMPKSGSLKPGVDGAMLSGDRALSHGLWEISFVVDDIDQYVRNVGDEEKAVGPLLQRLAETSIVREVAGRRVEEITRGGRDLLTAAVQSRIQREIDDLELGLRIERVTADTMVPGQVSEAFDDVTAAESEKNKEEELARTEESEILNRVAGPAHKELKERIEAYSAAQIANAPQGEVDTLRVAIDDALSRAGGEVSKRLEAAEFRGTSHFNDMEKEYLQFKNYREQYAKYPVTLLSLWYQMRTEVLVNDQVESIYVPPGLPLDLWIDRDPQRQMDAAKRLLLQRTGRE
jgi:regulator of protease activity HflC (stomatin/prohibitin superfamily)